MTISVAPKRPPGVLLEGHEVMQLLLDSSSRFHTTEHYIEAWEQAERGRTQGASAVFAAADRTATKLITATMSGVTMPLPRALAEIIAPALLTCQRW